MNNKIFPARGKVLPPHSINPGYALVLSDICHYSHQLTPYSLAQLKEHTFSHLLSTALDLV